MTEEIFDSSMNNSDENSNATFIHPIPTLVLIEQYMSIYGPFILTTLGIIGNILSILIFLSPRYRRQSSHFYLLSLALSDLCFLIINLVEDTFRNHNALYHSRINILDRSSSMICISVQYARNTTRLLSSWIVVSFTIERLIVVFYPLKRAIICRRKIARFVVLILFMISLLSNINVPFHYGIIRSQNNRNQDQTICDILPEYRSIYMRFAIIEMIKVYLVPMCIIGLVNALICCKLWRKSFLTEKEDERQSFRERNRLIDSRSSFHVSDLLFCFQSSKSTKSSPVNSIKEIKQIRKSRQTILSQNASTGPLIVNETDTLHTNGHPNKYEQPELSKTCSISNASAQNPLIVKHSTDHVKNYIQSRTNRVTMTLLLVSCSFLLLNTPYCAVWIINYIHRFGNSTLKSIKEITELFMLTNFCINFLLYCVSGKVFRTELIYLLRCRCKELYDRNEIDRLAFRKSRQKVELQMNQSRSKNMFRNNPYSSRQ